ncbi:MAG: hypothetical protein GF311_16995 [Candidatus Lokiarchaeota archaeon]|nr:hypothetical protein [Candidatus Lokiarchaeota archaeon]
MIYKEIIGTLVTHENLGELTIKKIVYDQSKFSQVLKTISYNKRNLIDFFQPLTNRIQYELRKDRNFAEIRGEFR